MYSSDTVYTLVNMKINIINCTQMNTDQMIYFNIDTSFTLGSNSTMFRKYLTWHDRNYYWKLYICQEHIKIIFVFLFQPTNAQIYITTLSPYITFNPTCFDISMSPSGSFNNLCLAKLRKFLKLWLLKLQFHKIIRLKYIKILFGRCWVIK